MSKQVKAAVQFVIGIDPGAKGAVALYCRETNSVLRVFDMPTYEVVIGGKRKNRVNAAALHAEFDMTNQIIQDANGGKPAEVVCVIEDVQARPNQSAQSTFALGHAAGVAQAVAAINGLVPVMVPPATWKRRMKLTADKATSLVAAREAFPEMGAYLRRAKDDGRAEAMLLAKYFTTAGA